MKIFIIALFFFSNLSIADNTVYLVRHAEKLIIDGEHNPDLNAIGQFRALNIAKQLSQVGITDIYSTQYHRTLQTAKPLADFLNLEIKDYDPRNLEEFAEQIKSIKGTILIVGHSNTTPMLTSLISGKTVKPIAENEYDNLYQVITTNKQIILNRFKSIPSFGLNKLETKPQSSPISHNIKSKETHAEKQNED
jgi:broad specificity phosphatase PhoE